VTASEGSKSAVLITGRCWVLRRVFVFWEYGETGSNAIGEVDFGVSYMPVAGCMQTIYGWGMLVT
jgi:hypothetical protein